MSKPKLLMAVYNEIDYDGRVQRAAEALSQTFDVTVFSIDSGLNYVNPHFVSKVVSVPSLKTVKGLRYLYFILRFFLTAIRFRPFILYAHECYLAFPGWLASRFTNSRLVYDAHELIIPEAETTLKSKREEFFYLQEKFIIRRADIVIAASEERAKLMQSHYRIQRTPLVIRNIPPRPKKILKEDDILQIYPKLMRNHSSNIRLVYAGDISPVRDLEKFVNAIKELGPRFELFLIGSGIELLNLQEKIKNDGLENNIFFLGKVPREHLHSILQMCDIGIISYKNEGLNIANCAPNKVYEYTQAGLPVIATCQPPLKYLINVYKIGLLVGCDCYPLDCQPHQITEAIIQLANNYKTYKEHIPIFLQYYNWECEQTKLLQAIKDC